MNARLPPLADERQMLARTRPAPFDQLRHLGRLSPELWQFGDALRRLHAAGWQATGAAVATIQTPEAEAARGRLAEVETKVGSILWPLLRRVCLEGAQLDECRDMLPRSLPRSSAHAVLFDRLTLALEIAAPVLTTKGNENG